MHLTLDEARQQQPAGEIDSPRQGADMPGEGRLVADMADGGIADRDGLRPEVLVVGGEHRSVAEDDVGVVGAARRHASLGTHGRSGKGAKQRRRAGTSRATQYLASRRRRHDGRAGKSFASHLDCTPITDIVASHGDDGFPGAKIGKSPAL